MSDILYSQPLRITEVKSDDQGMEVAGYVSTFGNRDHGGDIMVAGAFQQTLDARTPVRFLFGHKTDQVLGKPLELKADDKGLFGRFQISQTSLGRDVHTLLKDGALDSFSIGYIPNEVEYDEKGARLLKGVELLECSIVAMPMNAAATVTNVKEVEDKAEWTTAYVNDLPDSAFALIDKNGRHYPHHGKDGKVDLPHLRAALSRIGDTSNAQSAKAKAHLERHARAEGIGGRDSKDIDDDCSFEDLLAQVGDYVIIAAEAAEALQQRRADVGRKLAAAHKEAINDLLDVLEGASDRFELIANPPPESKDEGMKLRMELARKLEARRSLLETA